ncbi:3-hydroxyacyl-CoA dehydrogenase [Castellaniella defragrans]|uniref:3-hydroxybutyryl-CoA dehydrogenase n=1 Tax=Castellaniella defragrans (strain DSM 12143 / CCUG 39792 / 65Phen) TaxID=1437824 RepID=W8WW87_CASD6|nr:3-hydroxyacyl-CoA dehydrogenase [Castellaniella defragrans]CDM23824.1 3-hydroxybutyryl-CoA dehydrogenase [Castellaniella defragrans 65Phen]
MMKVAVVGAGLIGQAWAIVFARGGCEVGLWDGDPQASARALRLIAELAELLQDKGLLDDAAGAMARIRRETALEQALADAAYVQENLPERLEVKQEIFARMDALAAPGTVLASSSSSIAASRFTDELAGRARCLVAHPVNPPYLVPVVELCGAPWTSPQALDDAQRLMAGIGQKPVRVRREIEGFILNRLQGALLREAFRLVEGGYVDAEDLDATVKDGLGLRWSFMGPFETIDLNAPAGIRDYCRRYGGLFESIAREQTDTGPWSEALIDTLEAQRRRLLPADGLEARRLWRDARLMELALHKRRTARDA